MSCVLGLGWAAPALAQDADVNALRHQVQDLARRVEQLETEVHALQQAQAARPAAPAAQGPGTKASLKQTWSSLKRGMAAADLEKILGPPSWRYQAGGTMVWYYHYPEIGNGSVTVSADGKVIDWQRPPLGWW